MSRTTVSTPDAPKAIGTYSQAIRAGSTVYLSGQIPLDPQTMELVTGASRPRRGACSTTCARSPEPRVATSRTP